MCVVIEFPTKSRRVKNAKCAESAFQSLTPRQPNTLSEYLQVTGGAFHTILKGDFNHQIQHGDCLTVEPSRIPQVGDLVAIMRNGKMTLTDYQPGHSILGVVIAKTILL